MELEKKIERAIKLLQSFKGNEIELSYSGGKDSDVILELAKMAGIPYRGIYKNTTIDPSGTIAHVKRNGVEVHNPELTFYQLIEKKGFPTRRARFCCEYLKEYKILDNSIQGIRRSESMAREKRYKEPVICRVYGRKDNKVNVYLPILDWTDKDVSTFIKLRGIQCHPLYYDVSGNFDVKRRLGCMGCPLQADKGLADFKANPKLMKAWIRAEQKWWDKPRERDLRSKTKFKDVYELFTHNVFFDTYNDFQQAINGMFGEIDCKEFLENYFNIKF